MLEMIVNFILGFVVLWLGTGLLNFVLTTALFVRPKDMIKHWRCVFSPWLIGRRLQTGLIGFMEMVMVGPLIVLARLMKHEDAPGYVNFDTVTDEVLDA